MRTEICNAILAHRVIELHYDYFVLVVEPHACGQDRLGNDVVKAYQVAGGAGAMAETGWKLLKLADVTSVRVRADRFGKRADYRRNDPDLDSIDCQA